MLLMMWLPQEVLTAEYNTSRVLWWCRCLPQTCMGHCNCSAAFAAGCESQCTLSSEVMALLPTHLGVVSAVAMLKYIRVLAIAASE